MRRTFFLGLLLLGSSCLWAQQKIDHLIVITTDGFRWQELFNGMDSSLAVQPNFNQDDSAASV